MVFNVTLKGDKHPLGPTYSIFGVKRPLEPALSAVELTEHYDFARRTLEKPQISIK